VFQSVHDALARAVARLGSRIADGTASLRRHPRSPLHRHAPERLLLPVCTGFGRWPAMAADRVPSSWFCTTSTVCSARSPTDSHPSGRLRVPLRVDLPSLESRACCIPLPILGFAAFRAPFAAMALTTGRRDPPRSAIHTLRRSPPARRRTASPQPLPPCRSLHTGPLVANAPVSRLVRNEVRKVHRRLRGVARRSGP